MRQFLTEEANSNSPCKVRLTRHGRVEVARLRLTHRGDEVEIDGSENSGDTGQNREGVIRKTMDGLSGRSLRFFRFLIYRPCKVYFEELRDESTVFTKPDITDAGIATGIKDLIRDLATIEAPYLVEWSKGVISGSS